MIAELDNWKQIDMTKQKSEGQKKLKKGDPLMFRTPSDDFADKFSLAMKAAGITQSELLRKCVELKLDEVVEILERERQVARLSFQRFREEKKKI